MAEKQQAKKRKMSYRIKWVVSPHRADRRTGAISPVPRDKYTQMHFDEIEKVFRSDKDEKHETAAIEVEKGSPVGDEQRERPKRKEE